MFKKTKRSLQEEDDLRNEQEYLEQKRRHLPGEKERREQRVLRYVKIAIVGFILLLIPFTLNSALGLTGANGQTAYLMKWVFRLMWSVIPALLLFLLLRSLKRNLRKIAEDRLFWVKTGIALLLAIHLTANIATSVIGLSAYSKAQSTGPRAAVLTQVTVIRAPSRIRIFPFNHQFIMGFDEDQASAVMLEINPVDYLPVLRTLEQSPEQRLEISYWPQTGVLAEFRNLK
jgi:hypothetical protein